MRIMHYSLGIPPLRSGGLTKYFWDFVKKSNNVSEIENIIVYPMKRFKKDLVYKEISLTNKLENNVIPCFEMSTNLTIPVVFGIRNTESYIKELVIDETKVHEKFFLEQKIEVIHLHTLMGLTLGFFKAAKINKIKIVYSSHDYFGLCSKTSLFDINDMNCNDYNLGLNCSACNYEAISDTKLFLSQINLFKKVNNFAKKIKPQKKSKKLISKKILYNEPGKLEKESYNHMIIRKFYINIFEEYVDHFHFNSSVAKEVFLKYIIPKNSSVINITHQGIDDLKKSDIPKIKKIEEKKQKFNILFLGPYKIQKGAPSLIKNLEEIGVKDKWHLNLYGDNSPIYVPQNLTNNVTVNGKYNSKDLKKILLDADLLVVPSLWNETFGFITLEALAMNIPVLISNNVGAKDLLINNFSDFIYENDKELQEKLKTLVNMERKLTEQNFRDLIENYSDHVKKMVYMYRKVLLDE